MRFQWKGFTSLLLTLAFLALGFSGVILYLTPRGRLANWTGWTILGLGKQDWMAVHINIALLFLIVAGLHIFLNWGMLWGYIKKKASLALNLKLEMLVAVLIAAGILVGTIKGVPPLGKLMTWNEQIKDYWESVPTTAPAPHTEELSVEQLARSMDLDVNGVLDALKQEGIAVEGAGQKILDVAKENSCTPADVFAAITKHFPDARERARGRGDGPGKGYGKGKGKGFGGGKGQGRGMKWKTQEQE